MRFINLKRIIIFKIVVLVLLYGNNVFSFDSSCYQMLSDSNVVVLFNPALRKKSNETVKPPEGGGQLFFLTGTHGPLQLMGPEISEPEIVIQQTVDEALLISAQSSLAYLIVNAKHLHRVGKFYYFNEQRNTFAMGYILHLNEVLYTLKTLQDNVNGDFSKYTKLELERIFLLVKSTYDLIFQEDFVKLFKVTYRQKISKFLRQKDVLPEHVRAASSDKDKLQDELKLYFKEAKFLRKRLKPYMELIHEALNLSIIEN